MNTAAPVDPVAARLVVEAALSKVGAPFEHYAAGPDAFDCRGFTVWAWAQAGVELPRSAKQQAMTLPQLPVADAEPGDIVFYADPGLENAHVGIYIGGAQICHADYDPGVEYTPMTQLVGASGRVQISSLFYREPWIAMRPATQVRCRDDERA